MLKVVFMIVTVFFKDPTVPPKSAVLPMPTESECRYKARVLKADMLTIDAVDQVGVACVVIQRATRD